MAYLMSKIEMLNPDELRQKAVFNFQGKRGDITMIWSDFYRLAVI